MNTDANYQPIVDAMTDIAVALDDISTDCRFELNRCNLPDEVRAALIGHLEMIRDAHEALCPLLFTDEVVVVADGDVIECPVCDPSSPERCNAPIMTADEAAALIEPLPATYWVNAEPQTFDAALRMSLPEWMDGMHPHDCLVPGCCATVPFDDEPYCFKHSPDEGSSLRGFSYRHLMTIDDREQRALYMAAAQANTGMIL